MASNSRHYVTPAWRSFLRKQLGVVIFGLALVTGLFGAGGFFRQYASTKNMQEQSASSGSATSANNAQQPNASPQSGQLSSGAGDGGPSNSGRPDWTVPFFRTVQLFLLETGGEDDADHPNNIFLSIARFSASLLFLIVSSAVIVRVVDNVRRLPRQMIQADHVVICGLGEIGLRILEDLHAAGQVKRVVIIEKDSGNTRLEYARARGASIVIGDAAQGDILLEARAVAAREVFAVTGDDGVNLEITAELSQLLDKRPRPGHPLKVYLHILDVSFATSLRPFCSQLHGSRHMTAEVYNVAKTAATNIVAHRLWPYSPYLQEEVAHYVVVGFGPMAQTLCTQLATLAHFPNRKRFRMTIADQKIDAAAREYLHSHPRFTTWTDSEIGVTDFPDEADQWSFNQYPLPADIKVSGEHAIQYVCNAEFVELPAGRSNERFAQHLAKRFLPKNVKPVIFVCGHNDHENFETAVELRNHLKHQGRADVPTFVWLPRQPALARALSEFENLLAFGECAEAASYLEITEPIRDIIGRIIFEDYEEKYGNLHPQTPQDERDKLWAKAPDDFKESSKAAADHMHIKLALAGFQLRRCLSTDKQRLRFDPTAYPKDLRILAKMEHNRWVAERLMSGWRFSAATDPVQINANKLKRLNKDLIPWDQLQGDQQKDFDQVDVVLRECQKVPKFCINRLERQLGTD
ncbi:MAG: NAD-binding protein [Planctomycetaceae bacterium]|nr:NAD-binding protein [Planctomycetaceae bacterium]